MPWCAVVVDGTLSRGVPSGVPPAIVRVSRGVPSGGEAVRGRCPKCPKSAPWGGIPYEYRWVCLYENAFRQTSPLDTLRA